MAFNIEDYKLKYYAEVQAVDGGLYRLEILQKSATVFVTKKIGELCGLSLELQGQQDDVTTPVVKTSLQFSMVDTADISDRWDLKHGDWSEFYTPDATLYLCQLHSKAAQSSEYSLMWSGFITPDSWQEDLGYRGTITITARDMVGSMAQIPYPAYKCSNISQSVRTILDTCLDAVSFPMRKNYTGVVYEETKGIEIKRDFIRDDDWQEDWRNILDAKIAQTSFEGKSCYEVYEQVLNSLGFVHRFTGWNECCIGPIANMCLMGYTLKEDTPIKPITFLGGSKTINPAYKKIIDTAIISTENDIECDPCAGFELSNISDNVAGYSGRTAEYARLKSGTRHNKGWVYKAYNDKGFADPKNIARGFNRYTGGALVAGYYENVAQQPTDRQYNFPQASNIDSLEISINPYNVPLKYQGSTLNDADKFNERQQFALYELRYELYNGEDYAFNAETKEWVYLSGPTAVIPPENQVTIPNPSLIIDGLGGVSGDLRFRIKCIRMQKISTDMLNYTAGIAVEIQGLTLHCSCMQLGDSVVNTINDERYNLVETRTSEYASPQENIRGATIRNYPTALFTPDDEMLSNKARFIGSSAVLPLQALTHLQILCYHIIPQNILTGDAVQQGVFRFGALYSYKGIKYHLHAGTFNLITSQIESGVFVQFQYYDDLWEEQRLENINTTDNIIQL